MKDKDLVGKSVISMADGAKIGTVKDLIFHGLELSALLIRGDHGEGLLPFQSVRNNGPDAITIESYTLVDWNAGKHLAPENRTSHDLHKLSVVDGNGHELGKLHEIRMDATGHVDEIAVRTEGVFGIGAQETLISGSMVRAVGPELITVEALPVPEPQN